MKLKDIRKANKVTLQRLSQISNISVRYLSDLERGKYEATESKIIRLSLALSITPNDLLGWEEIVESLKNRMGEEH